MIVNGEPVVATLPIGAERLCRRIATTGCHLFRVSEAGCVREGREFTSDQEGLDGFCAG